jgi:GGDEF domain-containing protein
VFLHEFARGKAVKRSVKPVPLDASDARAGEGVILVVQDNAEKKLVIAGMNDAAVQILGYEGEDITGRRLETVLSPKTAEFLADELEYEEDAPDFGEVLARQRQIRLRHRLGDESQIDCNVSRVMSDGMNARFHMVIPNNREVLAKQKIRDFIALNLAGRQHLDPATHLPDRDTAEAFLPLLKNFLAESELAGAFAIVRIDRFDKSAARYGAAECVKLLAHVAHCCRTTFRTEDAIFALSDRTLGLALFDIGRESARHVLTRLRWSVRNHRLRFGGKDDFSVTISVVFDMLDRERGDGLLVRCEEAVKAIGTEERNGLTELSP